jgi:hypothetical protein
MIQPQNLL